MGCRANPGLLQIVKMRAGTFKLCQKLDTRSVVQVLAKVSQPCTSRHPRYSGNAQTGGSRMKQTYFT
jgi:hypothetical protein